MNHVNYDYVFQQNCDLDHKNAIFLHCYFGSFFIFAETLEHSTLIFFFFFAEDNRNDRTSRSKRAETD